MLFPGDCVFQPLARCRALAASVTAGGARLFEHSKVMRIEPGRVVCDDGEVRCKSVIVAVDGGLEDILPELVGRVRTARLQMIGTEPLASTVFERPVYSRYGYDYWQQLPDGRVVVGGKRDMFEDAEWTRASLPESRVQEAIERMLRAELGVTGRVTHRWAASVGYTDEPLPVFDQVRPQVWAIGGYSGTGNIIGGLYGRMAAQVVSEGESGLAEVFFGDCYATVSR